MLFKKNSVFYKITAVLLAIQIACTGLAVNVNAAGNSKIDQSPIIGNSKISNYGYSMQAMSLPVNPSYVFDASVANVVITANPFDSGSFLIAAEFFSGKVVPMSTPITLTGDSSLFNVSVTGNVSPTIIFDNCNLNVDYFGLVAPAIVISDGANVTMQVNGNSVINGNSFAPTIAVSSDSTLTLTGENTSSHLTVNGNGESVFGPPVASTNPDIGKINITDLHILTNAVDAPVISANNVVSIPFVRLKGGSITGLNITNSTVRMYSDNTNVILSGSATGLGSLVSGDSGNIGLIQITDSDVVMSGGSGNPAIALGAKYNSGSIGTFATFNINNSNVSIMNSSGTPTTFGSMPAVFNGNSGVSHALFTTIDKYTTAPIAGATISGVTGQVLSRSSDFLGTGSLWLVPSATPLMPNGAKTGYITNTLNLASLPTVNTNIPLEKILLISPDISSQPSYPAQIGTPFSQVIPATIDGANPSSYSISTPTPPTGMTYNSSTRTLSGTPTNLSEIGSFPFPITITSGSQTITIPYVIDIQPTAPIIGVTATMPSLEAGIATTSPVSLFTSVSGGTGSGYTYTMYSYSSPTTPITDINGLAINNATGTLSGTPSAVGPYDFYVRINDSASNQSALYEFAIVTNHPAIVAPNVTSTTLSTNYSTTQETLSTALFDQPTGGTGTYSYSITNESPALSVTGMDATIDPLTRKLNITPDTPGSYSFYVLIESGVGVNKVTKEVGPFQIVIVPTDINAIANTLPNALANQSYSSTPLFQNISGGTQPYTFTLVSSTPANLFTSNYFSLSSPIDENTTISSAQVPLTTVLGMDTVSFTINISDSGSFTEDILFTVRVQDPAITPLINNTLSMVEGKDYLGSTGIPVFSGVSGGTGAYAYSINWEGTPPTGVTFNTSTGLLEGNPTTSGSFNFTVTATSGNSTYTSPTKTLNIGSMVFPPPANPLLRSLNVGQTYTAASLLDSTQIPPGSTFAILIPPVDTHGMTITGGNNILVSGTTTIGTTPSLDFTVTATNNHNPQSVRTFVTQYSLPIVAPPINFSANTSLTDALLNSPYPSGVSLFSATTGGSGNYSYLVNGILPAGMSIASDGTLQGTPTASGVFQFEVAIKDNITGAITGYTPFTLRINAQPITLNANSSLSGGTQGSAYSENLFSNFSSSGYSFYLSGKLPAGLTFDPSTGKIEGTPTEAGNFSFSVDVVSSEGAHKMFNYTLNIAGTTTPSQDPSVIVPSALNLDLSGNNVGTLQISLGASGSPNIATRAEITIEDPSIADISSIILNADGTVTITAKSAGTTNIIIKFYNAAGEMIAFTKSFTLTVTEQAQPPVTINSGRSSGGSSWSSGGSDKLDGDTSSSKSNLANTAQVLQPLTQSQAEKAFNDGMSNLSSGNKSLTLVFKNTGAISKEILDYLEQKAKEKGVKLTLHLDTISEGKVVGRITLLGGSFGKGFTPGFNFSCTKNTEAIFRQYYKNQIMAVCLNQQGDLGRTISVSVILPKTMTAEDLVVYSYNSATKTYQKISNAKPTIDSKGYLRFETTVGGTFVISNGDLTKLV